MPPASPKPMTEMRGRLDLMLGSAVTRSLLRPSCGGPSPGALRAPPSPGKRGRGPSRQRPEGEGGGYTLHMPPDGVRRLDHEPQLGDLVIVGDVVAAGGAGEAALRADSEVLHRHEARRLIDAAAQHVPILQHAVLGG